MKYPFNPQYHHAMLIGRDVDKDAHRSKKNTGTNKLTHTDIPPPPRHRTHEANKLPLESCAQMRRNQKAKRSAATFVK